MSHTTLGERLGRKRERRRGRRVLRSSSKQRCGGAAQVRGEGHRQDHRDAEAEGQLHRGSDEGGGEGGGGEGGGGGGVGGVEEMMLR